MDKQRLELLQGMPVFGGIDESILQSLVDMSDTVEVPAGSFFFHEGDEEHSMYVLESGEVIVLKNWEGQQYFLSRLSRGDCLGEMAMIDLDRRAGSVLAVKDCSALVITTDHLHEIYQRDVTQFAMIQMNLSRELSRRLRKADERIFLPRIRAVSVGGGYEFISEV